MIPSPPHAPAIASEWLRRVEAEYSSAARTHVFTHWLIQLGASPDLIRAGLRIVDDELTHAELSSAVVGAVTGDLRSPALAQEHLDLRREHADLLDDVVSQCLAIFCLGETVAVPLFSAMRSGCDQPVARAALDRILLDEVRHRDFGWTALGWLLHLAEVPVRAGVDRFLGPAFRQVRSHYADTERGASTDASTDAALHRWGLIPASRYSEILERCATQDYLPRFDKLGIDARPMWDAACASHTRADH